MHHLKEKSREKLPENLGDQFKIQSKTRLLVRYHSHWDPGWGECEDYATSNLVWGWNQVSARLPHVCTGMFWLCPEYSGNHTNSVV